jgi:hypothetical protein
MRSNEQSSFYRKRELISRQQPRAKTRNLARVWGLLQTGWQKVIAFMTDKSESHTQPSSDDWWHSYGWQARIYAYLPTVEEERDWLEKIYRQLS